MDPLLRFDCPNQAGLGLKVFKAKANELKWKVKQALKKSKPPKWNISNEEKLAIKQLQSDENIIILQAGKKGNTSKGTYKVEYNKLAAMEVIVK